MSSNIARKLFARFFLGIATDEEKQAMYNSSDSEELLKKEWEAYSSKPVDKPLFDKKRSFNSILHEINSNEAAKKEKVLIQFARKYAAILIVGVMILGGIGYFGMIQPTLTKATNFIEYSNDFGSPQEILLADGTKVILNNQSKLTYPEKFAKSYRKVILEGEAYFDVAHNKSKPFVVKALDIDIKVLGTQFNVNAFKNSDLIETTLIEGSVRVEKNNPKTKQIQKVVLTPNHKATFYKSTDRIIMDKVDVKFYKSWIEGKLIFDNDVLADITRKLEIKYNTKIILSDDVKNKHRYTITITDESIEQVLSILSKTSPVEFSKANNEYLIYARK